MHTDCLDVVQFAPEEHVTLGLQLQFALTAAGCNLLQLWCVAICSNCGVLQFAPTVVCCNLLQLWCFAVCSNCGVLQLVLTVVCCSLLQLWCAAACSNCGVLQFAPTVVGCSLLQLWWVAAYSNCGVLQLTPTVVCCSLLQLEYVKLEYGHDQRSVVCTHFSGRLLFLLSRHVSWCIALYIDDGGVTMVIYIVNT